MASGKDKIAQSLFEIEPSSLLDLYRVYPNYSLKPEVYYNIHNGSVFGGGVVWQGEVYSPIPIEAEGFSVAADGKPNRPILRISNKDNLITSLLANNSDFKDARIERRRTFIKFLDDENFDGGNPWGEPDQEAEITVDYYLVAQKRQENKVFVELELTNPLDIEDSDLTSRRIMGRYCYWKYRGEGCEYKGAPLERPDGRIFTNKDDSNRLYAFDYDKTTIIGQNRSYFGMEDDGHPFVYANPNDLWDPNRQYQRGSIVFTLNNKVRIQDVNDPSVLRPLLTYYVARDYVAKNRHPELNPELWEKDGCNKRITGCKKRFSEEALVQEGLETINYEQRPAYIPAPNATELSYWRPATAKSYHTEAFKFSRNYFENQGAGDCDQGTNTRYSARKAFTVIFHISSMNGEQGQYGQTWKVRGSTDTYKLFKTSTPLLNFGGALWEPQFRIHMHPKRGSLFISGAYYDYSYSSQYKRYECDIAHANVPFFIVDDQKLEQLNINLFYCKDLTIIIKKIRDEKLAVFETTISGYCTGEGGSTAQYFDLKHTVKRLNLHTMSNYYPTFFAGVVHTFPAWNKYMDGTGSYDSNGWPSYDNEFFNGSDTDPNKLPITDTQWGEYLLAGWGQLNGEVMTAALWTRALSDGDVTALTAKRQRSSSIVTKVIKRHKDIIKDEAGVNALKDCFAFYQDPHINGDGYYQMEDYINANHLRFSRRDFGYAANGQTWRSYYPYSSSGNIANLRYRHIEKMRSIHAQDEPENYLNGGQRYTLYDKIFRNLTMKNLDGFMSIITNPDGSPRTPTTEELRAYGLYDDNFQQFSGTVIIPKNNNSGDPDFTPLGAFETMEIQTNIQKFVKRFLGNLPFGGFPGTDGFAFRQ